MRVGPLCGKCVESTQRLMWTASWEAKRHTCACRIVVAVLHPLFSNCTKENKVESTGRSQRQQ